MKKYLGVCIAALLSAPVHAEDTYTIDPTHTWPSFEVNHLGYSTQRGRFGKTNGKVTLDVAAKTGGVDLTIDTASIDMGFAQWNEHMRGIGFFNVTQYPSMRFVSDKLLFDGDNVVGAVGKFTLLDTTRPLTLKVENFHCAPHPLTRKMHCGANITATIQRTQYGMAKYVPMVGDEIKLYSPVEADKD